MFVHLTEDSFGGWYIDVYNSYVLMIVLFFCLVRCRPPPELINTIVVSSYPKTCFVLIRAFPLIQTEFISECFVF